jgi:hypothetical protein
VPTAFPSDVGSLPGEPVERAAHLLSHRVTAGMPRVADDDQLRVGPGAGELPGGAEWAAQVEAAVDQDTEDSG